MKVYCTAMFRSNVSVAVISIKTKKVINVTNLTAAVFSRITPALHLINYIVFDRTELEKSVSGIKLLS